MLYLGNAGDAAGIRLPSGNGLVQRVARQAVFHDRERPSRLLLSVV